MLTRAESGRALFAGVELPYPQSIPQPEHSDSLFTGFLNPVNDLTLLIDEHGRATSVRSSEMTAASWQRRIQAFVARFSFAPGKVKGEARPMSLQARLMIDQVDSLVTLAFPLDTLGRVKDPYLYARNLELQGIQLPSIEKFPWYHATVRPADSLDVLRYVLAKLEFDQTGRARKIKLVGSNYSDFKDQILTAINYGHYLPGKGIDAQSIRSMFLLVTFFPTSRYPTKPWTPESQKNLDLHDQLGIRLLFDTTGIMIPPLPVSRTAVTLTANLPSQYRSQGLVLRVRIGEDGSVRTFVPPSNESKLYPLAMALEGQVHFYPAVGFSGRPRILDTAVLIRPEGASTVRISFPWLPPLQAAKP